MTISVMFKEKKSSCEDKEEKKGLKSILLFVPEGSHGDDQLHLILGESH